MSTNESFFLDVSAEHAPVVAAFRAAMGLPAVAAVQAVDYHSSGRTLIIGPADIALDWAERLKDRLDISVLMTEARGNEELPPLNTYPLCGGCDVSVKGWLGNFSVSWQEAPIPPHGEMGALDFSRTEARSEKYDLVFDLSREALIRLPHPPQGYFAAGRDPVEQFDAVLKLTTMVGEFEKPRFFDYKAEQCAHARNRIEGCNKCIDICSTGAITAKDDGVSIEPHLCMGCGACASACPSGAMRYAYPSVPELGLRLKTMLSAYQNAGGEDAVIVFHDRKGEDWLLRRAHRLGLPGNLLPVGVHDIASLGPDLLLGALCYGAAHVVVLQVDEMPEAYTANLQRQMMLVKTIVSGFGYPESSCRLVDGREGADGFAIPDGQAVCLSPASFNLFADKRRTLEFCIDHLQAQVANATQPVELIVLPADAPFGTLGINTNSCTLCMACVGACPAKALQDNPELPQLRFIEHNCVQCGICVDTCPEKALTKTARLLLTPEAKKAVVLNEAKPFHCIRCAKPFGTQAMVDGMLKRLSGHSLFADGAALKRLQMCGDCRVVDMLESKNEMTVEDLPR